MSAPAVQDDEDPVFNAICFLALQRQIADTSTEPMALDELESLNRELLSKFQKAAEETRRGNAGLDLLERARQMLGMNLAAGLYRKPKGVDVPKDLNDEIERAIDDESNPDDPDESGDK